MAGVGRADRASFAAFDLVVIAASAGGIEATLALLSRLPGEFPAPIMVVQHLPPSSQCVSQLPLVLQRSTSLRVKWAENGEYPAPGTIYVAPQDMRTEIDSYAGRLRVRGAGRLRSGPNADLLLCSATQFFGSRVLAVILSGVLSDGAEGAASVARAGGRVLVQDPEEAQFADMPRAAMRRSKVGLPFDSASLASVITNLVMVRGAADWFGIGRAGVGAGLLAP